MKVEVKGGKGVQNKKNKEYGNNQENKTTMKVYDLNSDEELNGDFGTVDHDNNSNNDNKYHILRAKV